MDPGKELFDKLNEVRAKLNAGAEKNIMMQQSRYKRQYDKKHNVVHSDKFGEGDLVQYLNGRKLSRKGQKMTGKSCGFLC